MSHDLNGQIAVLTAGRDRPYALGFGEMMIKQGIQFDFIGSDEVNDPWLVDDPNVNFLNLRGDQSEQAGFARKMSRVLRYYARLMAYAFTTRTRIFHILWNNKFEWFDRTLLMLYYRMLGKRVVFTAHNVNAGKRDNNDSWLNRVTLKIQYSLCDCVFVHTRKMEEELIRDFRYPRAKVRVIPFGINNTLPDSGLSREAAREELGLAPGHKVVLFFGNLAPYKGVEYLVDAFGQVAKEDESLRLVIAGQVKNCPEYWAEVGQAMDRSGARARVVERIEYVPDEKVEVFTKAADVLVLPYTHIFQSGVLFVGYSFGLPVIATDVGSLKEDIEEGRTGYVCRPRDPEDLARALRDYFASELYRELDARRGEIKRFANEKYSWLKVGDITTRVYREVLGGDQ